MLPCFWNQLAATWRKQEKLPDAKTKDDHYWYEMIRNGEIFDNITLSKQQIEVIEQEENQLLINGSAGSGKSLTLIGRMVKVMAESEYKQRILYISFSPTLREDAVKRSTCSEIFRALRNNHDVHFLTFHFFVSKILTEAGLIKLDSLGTDAIEIRRQDDLQRARIKVYAQSALAESRFKKLPELYSTHLDGFLSDEFLWMKANGIIKEEHYLNCERTGRGINPRLTKEQRKTVFALFVGYHRYRYEKYGEIYDAEDYALQLLKYLDQLPEDLKYDHIFIDEVQDLQPMQIKALRMLNPKSLILSGDNKQRIYKRTPYSLRALGIHVEGRRTKRLRVNYRSTKQIMNLARSIQFMDTENDREDNLLYVREGHKPEIRYYTSDERLSQYLIKEIHKLRVINPSCSVAIIHRYDGELWKTKTCRIRAALAREFEIIGTESYGIRFDYTKERKPLFYTDAFAIKGLEFDYVFILNFDNKHYPKKEKLDLLLKQSGGDRWSDNYVQDENQLRNDELKILYVAITRAKEKVVLLYSEANNMRISPFIREFNTRDYDNYGFNKSPYGR